MARRRLRNIRRRTALQAHASCGLQETPSQVARSFPQKRRIQSAITYIREAGVPMLRLHIHHGTVTTVPVHPASLRIGLRAPA
jgi:hypothetical protein